MHDAGDDEVHEIVEGDETPQIPYCAERQWDATPHETQQRLEVRSHPGTIHKGRPHDDDFDRGFVREAVKNLFGLELADGVRAFWTRRISLGVRPRLPITF